MLSEEGGETGVMEEEDLHFVLSEHVDNLGDKRCVWARLLTVYDVCVR